jgi:hypothetical protein
MKRILLGLLSVLFACTIAQAAPTTEKISNNKTSTNASHSKTAEAAAADNSEQVKTTALLNFAQQVCLKIYNYDYKSYEFVFREAKVYFSEEGWNAFVKALNSSKNLEYVKEHKITVSANLLSDHDPHLLNQQLNTRIKSWNVAVPIHVHLIDEHQLEADQYLMVNMTLVANDKDPNGNGFSVTQIVAKEDSNLSPVLQKSGTN